MSKSNLQIVLQQQLNEMEGMDPTNEVSTKIVDKICRIIDDLVETSNVFKDSDVEAVRKLAANVESVKGAINNVKSGALNNEKTVGVLRNVLRELHISVRQFRGVYIKDNTTGCPIKDARLRQGK
jgi:hypothetical protein